MRFWVNPVFMNEMRAAGRRWHGFAGRSLLVAVLLAALFFVWSEIETVNHRNLAKVGETFFYALTGTQLALVLIAAPASAAGSLCVDKRNGTLLHLLMTDLSDAEIAFGKLAARLVRVFGLVLCALPVLCLGALLGGIEPVSLVGAFLVTTAIAIFTCTLAVGFSLVCDKTYQVLLGTYVVIALWLMMIPMERTVFSTTGWLFAWRIGEAMNPFYVVFSPYMRPGVDYAKSLLWFTAVLLSASAILAFMTWWRLRVVCQRHRNTDSRKRRLRMQLPAVFRKLLPSLSLDGNPVLWREIRQRGTSRLESRVWLAYAIMGILFGGICLFELDARTAAWTNGFLVSIGLLLFSFASVTILGEERTNGNIDLLLSTPLSAREIVTGKWLGGFLRIPLLALLPCLIGLACVCIHGQGWANLSLLAGRILADGAAITSFGLATATWCGKLNRALVIVVTTYTCLAVGTIFIAVATGSREPAWLTVGQFFGPGVLTFHIANGRSSAPANEYTEAQIVYLIAYLAVAGVLFLATMYTFDRNLGRIATVTPCGLKPHLAPTETLTNQPGVASSPTPDV